MVKDHKRETSLHPLYYGTFVVRVMRPNVQIRDNRRGLRVIHLNNCRVLKHSGIVELPPAYGIDLAFLPTQGELLDEEKRKRFLQRWKMNYHHP